MADDFLTLMEFLQDFGWAEFLVIRHTFTFRKVDFSISSHYLQQSGLQYFTSSKDEIEHQYENIHFESDILTCIIINSYLI